MVNVVASKTKESDKNKWATTWFAFADAQKLFGRPFLLDVCAEPQTAKVDRFMVSEDTYNNLTVDLCDEFYGAGILLRYEGRLIVGVDALVCPWEDCWWCNPPFDNKLAFLKKAAAESKAGKRGMMMLPYEPLTAWWRTYVDGVAALIYEPDGRYNFFEADGVTQRNGVNFGCAFVLFDESRKTTPRVPFKRGFAMELESTALIGA